MSGARRRRRADSELHDAPDLASRPTMGMPWEDDNELLGVAGVRDQHLEASVRSVWPENVAPTTAAPTSSGGDAAVTWRAPAAAAYDEPGPASVMHGWPTSSSSAGPVVAHSGAPPGGDVSMPMMLGAWPSGAVYVQVIEVGGVPVAKPWVPVSRIDPRLASLSPMHQQSFAGHWATSATDAVVAETPRGILGPMLSASASTYHMLAPSSSSGSSAATTRPGAPRDSHRPSSTDDERAPNGRRQLRRKSRTATALPATESEHSTFSDSVSRRRGLSRDDNDDGYDAGAPRTHQHDDHDHDHHHHEDDQDEDDDDDDDDDDDENDHEDNNEGEENCSDGHAHSRCKEGCRGHHHRSHFGCELGDDGHDADDDEASDQMRESGAGGTGNSPSLSGRGTGPRVVRPPGAASRSRGPPSCDACSTEFESMPDLAAHVKEVHNGQWQCTTCGRAFKRSDLLVQHRRNLHNQDRSFVCDSCKKPFGRKDVLAKHVKSVHENVRDKMCDVGGCGRTFTRTDLLEKHKRIMHPAGPRNPCPVCGAPQPRRDTLKKHIRVEHPEEHARMLQPSGEPGSTRRKLVLPDKDTVATTSKPPTSAAPAPAPPTISTIDPGIASGASMLLAFGLSGSHAVPAASSMPSSYLVPHPFAAHGHQRSGAWLPPGVAPAVMQSYGTASSMNGALGWGPGSMAAIHRAPSSSALASSLGDLTASSSAAVVASTASSSMQQPVALGPVKIGGVAPVIDPSLLNRPMTPDATWSRFMGVPSLVGSREVDPRYANRIAFAPTSILESGPGRGTMMLAPAVHVSSGESTGWSRAWAPAPAHLGPHPTPSNS